MKYENAANRKRALGSRPARALWIEIPDISFIDGLTLVEAREGLVD